MQDKETLLRYLRNLGIEVHTGTKARGHQGFYLKNRIDISKNILPERFVPTLLHEFAHYVHSKIEPFMERTGGTLEKIFDDDNSKYYLEELVSVTNFVDNNSKYTKLLSFKSEIKEKISIYDKKIKEKYPKFQRSKKFKEFDKYIKNSNAKYLLKYDRVKITGLEGKNSSRIYSVDNIENDFTDMPDEFVSYIRLKSCQKRLARLSAKISGLNRYYNKPAELFARFVEGLYIDYDKISHIAPASTKRFKELLECGYYKDLYGVKEFILKPEELVN